MQSCKSVYEPREDSTMLERYVRRYAKGKVLDMGTGSGIQAIAAAQNKNVSSVLATDIQKGVIRYCKKNIKNKKIRFFASDLFEIFKKNKQLKNIKFDTIIFNPPYLPQELKLRDLTIEAGKKGYEVIERFLSDVNNFLKADGIVLIALSSLTKKEKVEEFIKNNLLDFEELEKMHIFFEDIYVYLLRKNEFLKVLENRGIKNIKYFTKGHRGLLFTGIYKNEKIAVKTQNPQSRASGRIENEAKWLEKLNKHKIGPKLLSIGKDYFVYKFIDGDFIINYFKRLNKNNIKKIIKKIFNQLFILDKLKIDKEEMHHPLKHVIVAEHNPYLIDFERMHYAQEPKNVTQFCQFLISGNITPILKDKGIKINRDKIIELAKIYKRNKNKTIIQKIIDMA